MSHFHFNSHQLADLKEEIKNAPSPFEGALKCFEARLPGLIANQPIGGCWSHPRKGSEGYGLLNVLGKDFSLHRLSYAFFNESIPEGGWVLHKCNNSNCWNPSHLYSGDAQDNAFDRVAAGTHRGKLPDETVFLIKRLIREGLSNKQVAERVGVTHGCIALIRAGKRHKDLAA
jgi:hypothetical protein